jgi:WS/DGAT/MGAT family acyltransferase
MRFVDRLGAEDRMMLSISEAWPQDIGAVVVLDGTSLLDDGGRFRIERVRDAVAARLHLVPRFRQVIHAPGRLLGPPCWVDAPAFDLAEHVRELRMEAPAGEPELLAAVEELRLRPLDRSRPLWEMWFLTGMPQRRVTLFVRIHHAIGDGLAAMTIVSAFLDRQPDAPVGRPLRWQPRRPPRPAELAADRLLQHLRAMLRALRTVAGLPGTLRRVRVAWPAMRELVGEPAAPKTSLNRVIGTDRLAALVRASYPEARRVGHSRHASVNDILLAATAAGARKLLQSRGELVEGLEVRAYVPVTMRRHLHGPEQGTHIAQMVVPLELRQQAPLERLRAIASETDRRKARTRTSLSTLFGNGLVRRLALAAVIRQRVNIGTASVPGSPRPAYLAGARLLEVFPLLALVGNVPLSVGAVSYAGTLGIGVTADRDAFPDFDVFVAGVREELAALGVARGRGTPAGAERR